LLFGGVFYPILEKAHQNPALAEQLELTCPLPLAYTEDGDYVLPLHAAVADRLLHMLSREKPELLLGLFCTLANALSPYVNRRTTMDRTPEARLAARLFSAEHITRPLLGSHADDFYVQTREAWQWNSRYWEHRALLTQATNIDTAVQFARHAVAIEAHPYPWTTLASLLVRKMEASSFGLDLLFSEIDDLLTQVFKQEAARGWRPTPHPYSALFHAAEVFLGKAGRIPPKKQDWIVQQIEYCQRAFSRDTKLNSVGQRLIEKLGKAK